MYNFFQQSSYNKVLILCPFWRCGSTLLAGVIAKHYGLTNCDELLYDPTIDPTYDSGEKNSVPISVDNTFNFKSATGKIHHHITSFITEDHESFDWPKYLNDPNSKWVAKIHADQFNFLPQLINDLSMKNFFQDQKNAVILLHRQGVVATLISCLEAMTSGVSHESRSMLHPRFQFVKESKQSKILDFEQGYTIDHAIKGIEKIYTNMMVQGVEHCNTWISQHKNSIKNISIMDYENFVNVPQLAEHLDPYKKNDTYYEILKQASCNTNIPKQLLFVNNRYQFKN